MKRIIKALVLATFLAISQTAAFAQQQEADTTAPSVTADAVVADTAVGDLSVEEMVGQEDMAALVAMALEDQSLHQQLKTKFVEG